MEITELTPRHAKHWEFITAESDGWCWLHFGHGGEIEEGEACCRNKHTGGIMHVSCAIRRGMAHTTFVPLSHREADSL